MESIASIADQGIDEVDTLPLLVLPSNPAATVVTSTESLRRSSSPKVKVDEAVQANLPDVGASNYDDVCTPESVDPVRDEIGLLRQASTQLSEDMRNDEMRSQWTSMAIGAAGVSLIGIGGYMIYKRYFR